MISSSPFILAGPGVVGVGAVLTGRAPGLIAPSSLGAVVVSVTSMISLIVLRRREPALERPFVAPFSPVLPVVAPVLAILFLAPFAASTPLVLATGPKLERGGTAEPAIAPAP